MAEVSDPAESRTIIINECLAIELMPNNNKDVPPTLCLHTQNDPEQSIVILLSEIHLLRDALADAGTRLNKMRVKAKETSQRNTRPLPDDRCGGRP